MRDFFATSPEPWSNPDGQLHIYALPEPDLAERIAPYCQVLAADRSVALQPTGSLHMTVQRLAFPGQCEQADATPRLVAALRARTKDADPLRFHLGEPDVTEDSVILRGREVDEFDRLTSRVREAVEEVLGPLELHFDPPAEGPHVTVAYGVAAGDSSRLARALGNVTAQMPGGTFDYRMDVGALSVVAVHQDPVRGVYTFDVIAEAALV